VRRFIHVPSHGTIAGYLALAVALGGTSYAATHSKVKAPDASGVFHACVNSKNGKVRLVTAGKKCKKKPKELAVQWSQKGPPGPAGQNGANGVNGANGATNVVVRAGASVTIPSATTGSATASCDPGERAVSGGGRTPSAGWGITRSTPGPGGSATNIPVGGTPTAWTVDFDRFSGSSSATLFPFVVCASP
jgi:hypothetical protein